MTRAELSIPSLLVMLAGLACQPRAARSGGPAGTAARAADGGIAGTYALRFPSPRGAPDSGLLELTPGSYGHWGQLVAYVEGERPRAVSRAIPTPGGVALTVAFPRGALRLALVRDPGHGDSLRGPYLLDTTLVIVSAVRRSAEPSPEMRELAGAEPFAPGVVSTDSGDSFGSLSPDGREFYFTQHRPDWSRHRIMVTHYDGARWSPPEPLPFSGTYNDREPKLSPDGRQLFFGSNRPAGSDTARRRDLDIWVAERGPDGRWGAPRHLDAPVNTDAQDFCPVLTASGTLYFISTRAGGVGQLRGAQRYNVWRARPANGRYAEAENLGPAVNGGYETNVYVTPDERVMLVSRDGFPDSFGGDDLYVSEFRGGAWTPMRHLGRPINSPEYDYGPLLSPDGRWLFFTSHRRGTGDIYRVDARLLGLTAAREER